MCRQPDQRCEQKQVSEHHVTEPFPDTEGLLQILRDGIHHHNRQRRQGIGFAVTADRHGVDHPSVVIIIEVINPDIFRGKERSIDQQGFGGFQRGIQIIQPLFGQPFGRNGSLQRVNMILPPEQILIVIINQHHRRGIQGEIRRKTDIEFTFIPLRQAVEQIALAAQHGVGGFIKADQVTDQRHGAVRERHGEDHGKRCQ